MYVFYTKYVTLFFFIIFKIFYFFYEESQIEEICEQNLKAK